MELQNFFYPVVRQPQPVIAIIEEKEKVARPQKKSTARKAIAQSE